MQKISNLFPKCFLKSRLLLNVWGIFLKLFILPLLSCSLQAQAQDAPKRLTAKFIDSVITIDGILDEKLWETATATDFFWQFFPVDSVKAKHATEIRILYNETTLYVGIRAEASEADYAVSTLRRDFRGVTNDHVSIMFDTFNDGANAFLFGVTPYGVRREVLISGGGANFSDFNPTWDVKWQAESKIYEDYYTIEMAIPFTSLKFKEGGNTWRFQSYRWNLQTNEQSAWYRVPQNQLLINLAFTGELVFEKPLGKARTPLAVIPYVNALSEKDFETGEANTKFKVGGDAKVAIGNGMNLDITVNPDFSNVEVDDVITNLTRFEVSLPEKRQFFIDNSDLFGSFGSSRDAIPFFSRRIGIAQDTDGNAIENSILGGVRLSGKLNEDWRLGFLNIQTDEDPDNEIASNNNMMLAVQKKVFSRSNIGVFMINRQTFGEYDFLSDEDSYNRVAGMDYNLASEDNVWSGKFYLHKSFQPGDSKGNLSSRAFLIYNTRNWRLASDLVYVDEEFRSDLGFIPRTDIFKWGSSVTRTFYPKKGSINKHSFRILSLLWWRPGLDLRKTDHNFRGFWSAEFKNQSELEFIYANRFIYLAEEFDPTRTEEGIPLPAETSHYFNQFTASYESNRARRVNFNAGTTVGQFFNGRSFSFQGGLSLRFQPYALLSLSLNYDSIRLPDPYPDADLWLLSPKIEITFSKSLFWSTLIQYSNQRDNLGINSRLQWRFAPLSDLFLVYNDNYFTSHFAPRFRSINLKFTYWLNI